MKKEHGPAFRKTATPLKHCQACRGKAVVRGLFHDLPCANCNASGWVEAETGEPLELAELVLQLGLRLREAEQKIQSLMRPVQAFGAAQQYEQNNRLGAGGTNYTGD